MAADTDAFSCVPIFSRSPRSAAMKNNVLFMNLENEHKSQIIAEMYRAEIKEGVSAIKQGQDRTRAGTARACGLARAAPAANRLALQRLSSLAHLGRCDANSIDRVCAQASSVTICTWWRAARSTCSSTASRSPRAARERASVSHMTCAIGWGSCGGGVAAIAPRGWFGGRWSILVGSSG